MTIQIRAEAFNFTNTVVFGGPDTTLGTSGFGTINGQANAPQDRTVSREGAFLRWYLTSKQRQGGSPATALLNSKLSEDEVGAQSFAPLLSEVHTKIAVGHPALHRIK